MICEHPHCARSITDKCSNHCQLDLCQEHIVEHRQLFLVQYEKLLTKYNQSLNERLETLETKKAELERNYQNELSSIDEHQHEQTHLLEEKTLLMDSVESFVQKKRQLLSLVKMGHDTLHQYDLEQVKLYRGKVYDYLEKEMDNISEGDLESLSSLSSSDQDVSNPLVTHEMIYQFRSPCPFIKYGPFGLAPEHHVRLCRPDKDKSYLYLAAHFHRFHHLTWPLAYKLTRHMIMKSDPSSTNLFNSQISAIDARFTPIRCPLNQVLSFSRKKACRKKCYQATLKQHLVARHRLKSTTANRIVDALQNGDDLANLSLA